MDTDSESVPMEVPQSNHVDQINGTLSFSRSDVLEACALCHRILLLDNEGNLESSNICGDCKLLLLEEPGTPIQNGRGSRLPRVRRGRYSSLESVENLFSQQFSNIINLARQRQPTFSGHEYQSVDIDPDARLVQHTSSRSTPSGSGRWRRVLSDTDSEGIDSLYGECESNISYNGYRFFHGESDTNSFSAYGGESNASLDGHSFIDGEFFAHPGAGSYLDSDTDIDPMHAGVNQWNSDEDENDSEWEDSDAEGSIVHALRARFQLPRLSSDENVDHTHRNRQVHSPGFEDMIRPRIGERRQTYVHETFPFLQASELYPYVGNTGDYLNARDIDDLIEHLDDTDNSRRGAPPASISFVNSLPCLVINEEQERQDGLACAICKDSLSVGTLVNQLPCFHLYHPSCILPWLSARSSCPLCRRELPTDDNDHEDKKQRNTSRLVVREIQQQEIHDDDYSDTTDVIDLDEALEFRLGTTEHGELIYADHATECCNGQNAGRKWFFLAAAAAPIVSLVGIVLVLWLGKPRTERREPIYRDHHLQGPHTNHTLVSGPPSQRENRGKRWWFF